ncbi:MAG: hypothetical protein QOI21_3894 [Actinomycetota bacterium]|nr:hypothetical protein [Actinomycetota bacterium]
MTPPATDPFEMFDGAYVLGALSPEERQAYEAHLGECDECARSVRELSGMPGLLSQVEPGMVGHEPPPSELLRTTLTKVAKTRRRRMATMVATVAVAAAACIALAVTVSLPAPETGSPGQTMTALGNFPVQADVGLEDKDWGTRVSMSCSYTGGRSVGDYVLVAVQHDGTITELASWSAVPKDTAHLVVATEIKRADIQALEVRTRSGLALLRLDS